MSTSTSAGICGRVSSGRGAASHQNGYLLIPANTSAILIIRQRHFSTHYEWICRKMQNALHAMLRPVPGQQKQECKITVSYLSFLRY
jgi:hypothetical protein